MDESQLNNGPDELLRRTREIALVLRNFCEQADFFVREFCHQHLTVPGVETRITELPSEDHLL